MRVAATGQSVEGIGYGLFYEKLRRTEENREKLHSRYQISGNIVIEVIWITNGNLRFSLLRL
jgi:hypothetical protein